MDMKRQTKTEERHWDIYEEYNKMMKDYKEVGPYLDKRFIYEQVAEKCRCSGEHVRKIVNEKIKAHSCT